MSELLISLGTGGAALWVLWTIVLEDIVHDLRQARRERTRPPK